MKTIEDVRQTTGVPAVIADHEGLITEVNERFADVFGWSRKEIVGKPLTALIPKDLHDAHNLGFSRFLTTRKPTLLNQPLKLKAVAKDGRVFDAEHFIVAELSSDRWTFGATIRPLA